MSWQAQYFNGTALAGTPLVERTEASIDLSSVDQLPQEIKDKGGFLFSARWTRSINGPGRFRISCTTDDGMRIWVDNVKVIDAWRGQAATDYNAERQLGPGPHTIKVEYFQGVGGFRAFVQIQKISGQDEQAVQLAWQKVTEKGHLTQSGLEAARIYEVDDSGEPVFGSLYPILYCMFNPASYSVKKSAAFSGKGLDEQKNYNIDQDNSKVKPAILNLKELWFDTSETYDTNGLPEDVSKFTDLLIEYAETTATKYATNFQTATTTKAPPPKVAFQWGTFRFLGVIESVTAKFTLFSAEGIPIRAKVGVKLKEFRHRKAYPRQNPTSKQERLERVWRVQAGQRLDTIAAEVYNDATHWRLIANHNRIVDPLTLHPGDILRIPPLS